jgi:uncharacterized SAM-binding protein YcdF (DUF218 family)
LVTTCRKAGTWLVKKDPPIHSDAIVMLMGSIPDRVLETLDIYKSGYSNRIILVEESMGAYRELEKRGAYITSNTAQCSTTLVKLGVTPDHITCLPGDAQSTQDETVIVREYLRTQPGIDTLTLVSSSDHTRRSSMIFAKAFKKRGMPVVVYCSPSKYTNYTGIGWWKSKEGIQTVMMEYLKIGNFWMFDIHKL